MTALTALKELALCPVCAHRSLVRHCGDEAPRCTWFTCRHRECAATLDLVNRRGVKPVPGGYERVEIPQAAP